MESARPTISLPQGGGAIRGINETFEPNPFTGTGNFALPIGTSAGRGGFGPSLSLQYSSGFGNSEFGLGWALSIPRVTRRTDRGIPRYDESDSFLVSGSDELVPADAPPEPRGAHVIRRYRSCSEAFARIEQWTHVPSGMIHWRATTITGVTNVYGRSRLAQLCDPTNGARVFEWFLEESFDEYGNYIEYEYARDSPSLYGIDPALRLPEIYEGNRVATQLYVRRIVYGVLPDAVIRYPGGAPVGWRRSGRSYSFEVVFDYGDWNLPTTDTHPSPVEDGQQELFGLEVPVREDRFSSYRSGFEVRTLRRCRRVLMFHHFAELEKPTLVRSTDLEYRTEPVTRLSQLASATFVGYRVDRDGSYVVGETPPTTFEYSQLHLENQRYRSVEAVGDDAPTSLDGRAGVALLDLFGDGLPDVVQSTPIGMRYWRNLGGGLLDRPRSISRVPVGVDLGSPGVAFGDTGGDGNVDLMVMSGPLPGFYETTSDGAWSRFQRFTDLPSFAVDAGNVRLVDLTGDGRPDALQTAGGRFIWFPSLGEQGFGAPQFVAPLHDLVRFPELSFDDPARRVRLADMTGDGLADLVFVSDGRIDYWPNVGYGRFGARVTMANTPRVGPAFDPARMFLFDVNGNGCSDLVYVDFDRVLVWFNRTGNGWSEGTTIAGTPATPSVDMVQIADFFGTGTPSIVWSEAFRGEPRGHLRALELCGGQKPYVLVEMNNNLGCTTRVQYGPSTAHLLRDRADGFSWETSLPFPVQVIDRVETIDHVSGARQITRFAYHHGCFDGREREFRGFGRVDRFDAEELSDGAHQLPPIETRTWFHTGQRDSGAAQARERYGGDPEAVPLDGSEVDERETPREAYRALRGAVLRSEVYARDRGPRAPHPYTVTEQRHRVMRLQPRRGDSRAIYQRQPLETLTHYYERAPDDPRISHTMTLEVDEWGNALRTVVVGYPRRIIDASLTPEDRRRQSSIHLVYIRTRFTNAIDDPDHYRVPVLCEQRRYELTGIGSPAGTRYSVDEWRANAFARLDTAAEIAFEVIATPGVAQKRLIDHTRSYFRADDLSHRLDLGRIESKAFAAVRLRLAMTPGLIASVYGDRVTEQMMRDAGYVNDDDDQWWVSSGRTFFSHDPADDPAAELAAARLTFFVPCRYRDAFGADTTARLDSYALLTTEVTDPLGNRMAATHDYRVMQPRELTDPNGNRRAVAFDAIGMVVATAVMGKVGEQLGDELDDVVLDVSSQQLDSFFADPQAHATDLLGRATTRIIRNTDRFQLGGRPLFTATIARDTHVHASAQGRVHIQFVYPDGFGREVQSKSLLDASRWVGTGAVVRDNKGNTVRAFEPFFDDTHALRPAHLIGHSSVQIYDPFGRSIATVRSDHAWSKLVIDAWRSEVWDVNDTVLLDPRSDPHVGPLLARLDDSDYLPTWQEQRAGGGLGPAEQSAARKTAVHAGTSAVSHADALGRSFITIAHNRVEREGSLVEERTIVRQNLDIGGAVRSVVDAAERTTVAFDLDVLGRRIHVSTVDSGERWTLHDVAGNQVMGWDSRGHCIRTIYDVASRPTRSLLSTDDAGEQLILQTHYGESAPDAEAKNLRGRVIRVDDQAGVATIDSYDFKGNAVSRSMRLVEEYKRTIDWFHAPVLEPDVYVRESQYDARDREVALKTPDGSQFRFTFDRLDRRSAIDATLAGSSGTTAFVTRVDHNARGARTRITYGNDVTSEYSYDEHTLRLTRVTTTRSRDGAALQDTSCVHDPVGNITSTTDAAQSTIYFANDAVTSNVEYSYDARYQLVEARGREHLGQQLPTSWDDRFRVGLAHPADEQAMRRYTETYSYDPVGNLNQLVHTSAGGNWTRRYDYTGSTNRLASAAVGTSIDAFAYDAHGSVVSMPHAHAMTWNHLDQLTRVELGGGGSAHYVYNAGGHRTRKVVEKNNGAIIEERIDLDGFEVFRRRSPRSSSRRETLHVMDGGQRIALIETLTVVDGVSQPRRPVQRYELTNHLSSTALELDERADIISYEEYYPFGGTSFQSMRSEADKPKRYRFASKERDEESGFVYFGARYYAPWLARWISIDPLLLGGDPRSPYAYCSNDPINRVDPSGAIDYRDANNNYVGSDGVAKTGVSVLLDPRDISLVQERYKGSWLARNGGALLSAGIGLLIGVIAGALLSSLGAAVMLGLLGLLGGGILGSSWNKIDRAFWSETPTKISDLKGRHLDVSQLITEATARAEKRQRLPTQPEDRKAIIVGEDGKPDTRQFEADERGGFHEEALVWGKVPNGQIEIYDSKPGTKWRPGDKSAVVAPTDTVKERPSDFVIHGTVHIHPEGFTGTKPEPEKAPAGMAGSVIENKDGGDYEAFGLPPDWEQSPSDGDLANAMNNGPEIDFEIVVGARDGWVYFYDNSNSPGDRYIARIRKSSFYR